MTKKKERIFDVVLFRRLFTYIKPYKGIFFGLLILVVLLATFSAATPKITELAIDDSIAEHQPKGFLFYVLILLGVLIIQTVFQLLFIFYAAKAAIFTSLLNAEKQKWAKPQSPNQHQTYDD